MGIPLVLVILLILIFLIVGFVTTIISIVENLNETKFIRVGIGLLVLSGLMGYWLYTTKNKEFEVDYTKQVKPIKLDGFYAVILPGTDEVINVNKELERNIEDGDMIEISMYKNLIINYIDFSSEFSLKKHKLKLVRNNNESN